VGKQIYRELERFSSKCGVWRIVYGGFYFHPSDEDLSLGAPERKKPLERQWFSFIATGEPL
jgi:hypothetical protein